MMANESRAYDRAKTLVAAGFINQENRHAVAIFACGIYIGDSIKEAIIEASKGMKERKETENGKAETETNNTRTESGGCGTG